MPGDAFRGFLLFPFEENSLVSFIGSNECWKVSR